MTWLHVLYCITMSIALGNISHNNGPLFKGVHHKRYVYCMWKFREMNLVLVL